MSPRFLVALYSFCAIIVLVFSTGRLHIAVLASEIQLSRIRNFRMI